MPNTGRPPVRKNDDLTLTIESLTNEGQGVARVNGYAVFVTGALAGETVLAHVIKVTPSYAVAKSMQFVTVSPERVVPACQVFTQCGGCDLWHLSYPAQLRQKRQWVEDAFRRLGGFAETPVREVLGMEDPTRYRNKAGFPFGIVGDAAVFGFYAGRSHRLVPLFDCPIHDERVVDAARRVSAWANECGVSVYDETTRRGQLRHVVARVTSEDECMAVVVTRGALPHRDELLACLSDCGSVWHNENPNDTNLIFGERFTLLAGKPALTEIVCGKRFLVGPQSFLQVNRTQTRVLYETALSLLDPRPDETVADVYCGVGTISLLLADRCAGVIGIEQAAPAVEDARRNAQENGAKNVSFLCGGAKELLPRLVSEGRKIDALVLDPPRKGCAEAALSAVAASGAKRVVYVSCNPATLARDCRILAAAGFSPAVVQPVDMFPQTCHVETVVLITRVKE